MNISYILSFYKIIPIIFLVFVFLEILKRRRRDEILKSFKMVLFEIIMPRHEQKDKIDEKELIAHMEQVYTGFLNLKQPKFFNQITHEKNNIALEIASEVGGSNISFYVAVPEYLSGSFEKHLQSIYPTSTIKIKTGDYTIFEPNGVVASCYLKLEQNDILPINTYKTLQKDPLSAIAGALSKIEVDEGAAIQIILRPANQKKWKGFGRSVLKNMKEGMHLKKAVKESKKSIFRSIISEIFKIFSHSSKESIKQETEEEKKIEENVIQAINSKMQKQAFEVNIRLIASAQDKEEAEEIIENLKVAFGQFSLTTMNGFKFKKMKKKNLKELIYDFSLRNFEEPYKIILNTEELASIFHFPMQLSDMPHAESIKSKNVAPPSEIEEEGVLIIGETSYRGKNKKVAFPDRKDRRRHFYTVGQTGTGKTSLLKEMIRQDIENGEGVGVIDPHGDLIEEVLAIIPPERIKDVVLFSPSDTEMPIGLNMLEYNTPEEKDFAVQEMISIFHKLFPPEIIGPMFEHYIRNAMLAIMADIDNPGTLVEIPRMFTDDEFMIEKLKKVRDPMVKNFWIKEWGKTTGQTRSDMLGYVVSKIGRFIENEMMRNIVGQQFSGFNLRDIMDNKKIFLANLSKGTTGEVNSSLLGLILVSKIQMAAMKRAQVPENERQDFYLYIDEFHNFTTDSIATILSEARKYRLNLILSHQYMAQLVPEIRDAVLGNVGTMASFRIGAEDAEFLEKQFQPEFSKFDLINLDSFNIIIKMMINNKISSSFKMHTIMPKEGNMAQINQIKEMSRLTYGKKKNSVKLDILKRT